MWLLTMVAGIAAIIAVYLMASKPEYLWTSLLAGMTAMAIDFAIEHFGISNMNWGYSDGHLSLLKVPLQVPLLFLFCGILATYGMFVFSTEPILGWASSVVFFELDPVQIILFLTSAYFMVQYFTGKIKTLTFWALPLSIALYISYPMPWMLAISILPMYIDYYLEKRLVRSSDISYKGYGDDVAVNVAISYFPTTLLILGAVSVILRLMGG
ncbi:MAG: hypothetical protein LLG16_02500 [Euryarchaeota archaeon]|nr:hypothetical protein [Euryarchaeota archaeon]